jgi:hypothetical protein
MNDSWLWVVPLGLVIGLICPFWVIPAGFIVAIGLIVLAAKKHAI